METKDIDKTSLVIEMVNSSIRSKDLFQHGNEITIVHNEHNYRLRLTSTDKLILTK